MSKIKIMALGGLGENGKNMYVVEIDDNIFILDAGKKYPEIDMYGVDAVIPNIDYLIDHKDKIQGIFVSHGHEDHIGAIPYLLKTLTTRVYGTHFTISLIENMLLENHMNVKDYKLFRINDNKSLKFGDVKVTFFNTTHSIPESVGICLHTKDGVIVYCTDFNYGVSSNGTYQTSFDRITDIGKNKVLALMSESLNAGAINRISNDSLLEHNFSNLLTHNKGRVFVGAFSTDLIRIQKIIDLAVSDNRKIGVLAGASERIIKVAMSSNYLRIPQENYFDISSMTKEEIEILDHIVVIVTGQRFEPYSTLVKMAIKEHELISFNENDKVVLVCPPIPGTERQTTASINTLYEYNTNLVAYDKTIIRSAHASPDDLKLLYMMLKPEYIVPIKGEYRHMYEQMLVAGETGYDRDHIELLDNGDVLEFVNGKKTEGSKIKTGDILIDGTSIGIVDNAILLERSSLAEQGVIMIYACVDLRRREIKGEIDMVTRGFATNFSDVELKNALGGLVERIINNQLKKKTWNIDDVKESLANELQKTVTRFTRNRPIIVPVLKEIK